MLVPTNEQRRATAKRKLERRLERQAKQDQRRRILTIAGGALAALALLGAVAFAVFSDKHKSNTAATTPSPSPEAAPPPTGPALPELKPSDKRGANCQYPPSLDPAAKPVKPPWSRAVPTNPATVSVSMVTSQGHIGLLLANDKAPCTVNSFVSLATQNFFDGTKCHRLTTGPELSVLQCGDPKGDGTGGPGYQFANEFPTDQFPPNDPKLQEPVIYPRGTLAMAHSAQPNSNGSQFFMVYRDSQLPPNYTVFGKIQADGLATLDKVAKGGVAGGGEDGPPATEITIKSVKLD